MFREKLYEGEKTDRKKNSLYNRVQNLIMWLFKLYIEVKLYKWKFQYINKKSVMYDNNLIEGSISGCDVYNQESRL